MPRAAAIALAIVVVSVFLSPLQRELYVGDETKYTEVVREMRAGSFFLPTLNGTPFTHKPPLHFWLVDLLTYPFGVYSIWPFVLPSLAAFVLLLWLMHRMAGPLAAFVCGTSLMLWGSAQTARMDVSFTALLALAAWMVERFFAGERRALLIAAIATGLAFLVKGPMAPVIVIALFAFEALRRRGAPRGNYALAVAIILVIPLLWLVPAVMIGGEPFWREIFYKQTVGRAVGAWVHRSPPWFYIVRAPATLAPWFFLLIASIVAIYKRRDERGKFAVSWILAVLVPYTVLSSKLDVYMIAMLPAVALAIARGAEELWGKRANLVMLGVFALAGIAGFVVHGKGPDGALLALPRVRVLFALLVLLSFAAIVVTLRSTLTMSTFATGLVPVLAFAYAAVALTPLANDLASTRPLVNALLRAHVAPEDAALYVCPHLWVRDMPPALARARQVDTDDLRALHPPPRLIVARRKDADAIADVLRGYHKVDELRMIGKWFDVYER
ncbi:MAG: glycosyltransferase family 39 protein [Acidobacteria bacterium]|nr:glycosyltransferase family 39 protein [Acidobacteriota bacterium]MBV9476581.1 glycosyltransferase family 39 protein [Acidobacteriota bacterium]